MNKSDSERIAALLEKKGYQPAMSQEQADLIVVVMCSVRQSPVNKIYSRLTELKAQNSKVILTGCILDADKEKFKKLDVEIRDFRGLEKIKPTRQKALGGQAGFVPIMRGCDNFCSYCVVPYTRGREKCRPKQDIIEEVKHLISQGIKEITLLGQNVNSYKDNVKCQNLNVKSNPKSKCQKNYNYDFADLLEEINSLPGDFKIRFLTNHPKDMSYRLINTVAKCEKVKKQIHLPMQSGDNQILKKMNRNYTRGQYFDLVKKIRNKIPNVELTTDIIVGFPTETDQQFKNTFDLVKKIGYKQMYVSCYSPRKGTAAEKELDDVAPAIKKARQQKLLCQIN